MLLRVLIVEDSPDDTELLLRELRKGDYEIIYRLVDTKEEMLEALDKENWDLVISDYVIPGFSGLAALQLLRKKNLEMPFLIVSGKIGEDIAVEVMKAGAHDFITKGNLRRLCPAIERELRETVKRQEIVYRRRLAEEALRKSIDNLQETLEGAVKALGIMAEKRDEYTAGHQQRVSKLATMIAEEMQMESTRVEAVRIAGLLHDIGKNYIPAEILTKPGRLSNLEMAYIKTHPQVGYDIVKTIPFQQAIDKIILQHHERINGRGYPNGLTGNEILPEARILAVADVIEAMASHRPYRPTLGLDKALAEIAQNKGVLYDPKVVEACLHLKPLDLVYLEKAAE